jgi:hypothetical protein
LPFSVLFLKFGIPLSNALFCQPGPFSHGTWVMLPTKPIANSVASTTHPIKGVPNQVFASFGHGSASHFLSQPESQTALVIALGAFFGFLFFS